LNNVSFNIHIRRYGNAFRQPGVHHQFALIAAAGAQRIGPREAEPADVGSIDLFQRTVPRFRSGIARS
jgi:hypothetical protein